MGSTNPGNLDGGHYELALRLDDFECHFEAFLGQTAQVVKIYDLSTVLS